LGIPSLSVRGTYTLTRDLSTSKVCIFKKKSSAYFQPVFSKRPPAAGLSENTGYLITLVSVWTDLKPAVTLFAGPENQHMVLIQVRVGNRPIKDVDSIGVQVGAALLDQAAGRSA
jgi:hypothetical protein